MEVANPFNQINASESFTLKCRPDVISYAVQWFKDGAEVNTSSYLFTLVPDTYDLIIENPQEGSETEGIYKCIATNEYGSLKPRWDFTVQIACKSNIFSEY